VYMCTALLPPGGYPIAVKYISYHTIPYHIISYHVIYHIIPYHISYIISYHIISCHIIYHIISYHIIYHIILQILLIAKARSELRKWQLLTCHLVQVLGLVRKKATEKIGYKNFRTFSSYQSFYTN